MCKFNFNISLSVLNHLGRNLYRNFITVIGEAVSNSWDADAENVWITIDKEKRYMSIVDDGIGMDEKGFQDKFLKIGYTKRKNNIIKSTKGRPFIGRKGIGKLALLSCAEKIHIATKTKTSTIVGGVIDNSELDKAITDDLNSQDYQLQAVSSESLTKLKNVEQGTAICFENITDDIINTIEYIKKAIALYFKFSLIDNDFNIYVNDELITIQQLNDLARQTQFVWVINNFTEPFLENKTTGINPKEIINIVSSLPIKGYIATTAKPANTKIRGTNEKVTLDLFVNGRLREKDILRHIPTARIVESYTFGQIYADSLDKGIGKDIFTSSREGIIFNDPDFQTVLAEIKSIFGNLMEQWDDLRRKYGEAGDPDNTSISPKARKAEELFNQTLTDMKLPKPKKVKPGQPQQENPVQKWVRELAVEAQFNIPSYAECFVSENLLRKYIIHTKMPLSKEAIEEASKWKDKEQNNKNAANISYTVRQSEDDIYYLDMNYLANLVDKVPNASPKIAGLSRSATIYKPLRDSVGHTSLLTENAKKQLNIEYNNIQARIVKLLESFEEKKK